MLYKVNKVIPKVLLELVPLCVLRASYIAELKNTVKGNYFNALCVELSRRSYPVKAAYLSYSTRYFDKYTKAEFDAFVEYLRTKGYMINAHGYIKSKNWKFWKLQGKVWHYKNEEGECYDKDATFYSTIQ